MTETSNTSSGDPQASEKIRRITVDYIKSNHFRVIHADGVFGGPTPDLNLEMVFWNSRLPIPQRIVLAVSSDGRVVEEDRVNRADQIREAEVAVIMNLEQAKSFHQWLGERIKKTKEIAIAAERKINDSNA